MRTSVKTLHFPMAGVDRSLSFRSSTEPSENRIYAAPFAKNVRGTDVFSGRDRGGSRPMLIPASPSPAAPTIEDKPTVFYRGRKVYADGKLWFASRTGDVTDFEVSGDGDDATRPAMGKVGFVSVNDAEDITAVFAISSDVLYISTRRSLWAIQGDVGSGAVVRVAENAGVVSRNAWTFSGGTIYLASADGIYAYAPGQGAARISDSVPEELRSMTDAVCQYDPENDAIHLFSDMGDWYFDIKTKAWWPQEFTESHRPLHSSVAIVDGVLKAAFYGKDGVWRVFGTKGAYETVKSCVAIGPFRCSTREDCDGMFDALTAVLGKGSGRVDVKMYPGKTAEDSVYAAERGDSAWSGTLTAGLNFKMRPRLRGAWMTVVLTSSSPWAFESMTAVTKALGDLR